MMNFNDEALPLYFPSNLFLTDPKGSPLYAAIELIS